MKTIDEIRQINLAALVEEVGGTGALANLIERSQSQVSQWVTQSKHSATGKPRVVSTSSARYIESKCNKPTGWLDKDHSEAADSTRSREPRESQNTDVAHNVYSSDEVQTVEIKRVKLKLSAGISKIQIDQCVETGEPVSYTKDWLQKRGLFPEDLLALEITGDSMNPNFLPGDVIVINTMDKIPKHNRVFAVNFDGQAVIKRLVYYNKEWFLRSDNEDKMSFPDQICRGGDCLPIGIVVDQRREYF